MLPTVAGLGSLSVILDPTREIAFDVGLPVLAGELTETIANSSGTRSTSGNFTLVRHDDWLVGGASLAAGSDLEEISNQLYRELFEASAGWHLARIWNYVPSINEPGPGGMENYGIFCKGRSLAFERKFGGAFQECMPAASAVGCQGGRLSVIFAAGPKSHTHIENPLQVPAYHYPVQYGPRAPSFARATVVDEGGDLAVYISGTAAIRGHATVAPEKTLDQLDCTLGNLDEISRACGIGPDLCGARAAHRNFKIYLRRIEDLESVEAVLDKGLLRESDTVSYLRAEICRKPLNVEIEATLYGVPRQ